MKKISVIVFLICFKSLFAQEVNPLKWQTSYGFTGSAAKFGNGKISYQNHQLAYGVYKDINKRWYWNTDIQIFGMNYNNSHFGFQSIDTAGNFNYNYGTYQFSAFGLGATYRVGYKFISKERFNASFFLGVNASAVLYGRSKSYEPNNDSGIETISRINGGGLGFLGGLQAEYMLKNNSSLFLSYEVSNFRNISFTGTNFGNLQIGFRKSFKN